MWPSIPAPLAPARRRVRRAVRREWYRRRVSVRPTMLPVCDADEVISDGRARWAELVTTLECAPLDETRPLVRDAVLMPGAGFLTAP